MTEDEAQAWIADRFGVAAVDKLAKLAELVRIGSADQNLVAHSTLDSMWTRHIVDSAQLIDIAVPRYGSAPWLDIGSGAGFPGLVVGILTGAPVILVEPRRRRVEFLQSAIDALGQSALVSVAHAKVEAVQAVAAVISARAVAPLTTLFDLALHCARSETIWVMPKGKSAREEVETAQQTWHGVFHVERSITDPVSLIVRASGVKRR